MQLCCRRRRRQSTEDPDISPRTYSARTYPPPESSPWTTPHLHVFTWRMTFPLYRTTISADTIQSTSLVIDRVIGYGQDTGIRVSASFQILTLTAGGMS